MIRHCGTDDEIRGFSKLSRLDFFVRFPKCFDEIRDLGSKGSLIADYAPRDNRYDQLFDWLIARNLLNFRQLFRVISLSKLGAETVSTLEIQPMFTEFVKECQAVGDYFRTMSGPEIHDLIIKKMEGNREQA